jgi:hypothetical protein
MLSAVITARNAGVSFETIRALLNRAGMPITIETLKKYYFDFRKELDIVIAAKTHAKSLASAQTAIQKSLYFAICKRQKTHLIRGLNRCRVRRSDEKEKFPLARVEGAKGRATENRSESAPSTAVQEISLPSKKSTGNNKFGNGC